MWSVAFAIFQTFLFAGMLFALVKLLRELLYLSSWLRITLRNIEADLHDVKNYMASDIRDKLKEKLSEPQYNPSYNPPMPEEWHDYIIQQEREG